LKSTILRAMNITGTHRSALDVAQGRLVFMSICFALAFILVAARIVDLSLIQGQLSEIDQPQSSAMQENSAPMRADIVDRNGALLATSLQTASLYADPGLIPNKPQVARELADTLPGLSYKDTLQKLSRPKVRFIWIQRNLTPEEQFAILKLGHPGLSFRTEYRRIYPSGPLAAHLVGFTGQDGHGMSGIERSFDDVLNKGGEPLQLSLDIRLQHILRRETKRAINEFRGNGGTGVIMDVKTGEVLAGVSLPDFDPNTPGDPKDPSHYNMLTQGGYELGSTFKIFSTAAVLEFKGLPLSHLFDARQPLKLGRATIHDFHPENRMLTIPEVFMHSSNIGAAKMGEMVGSKGLKNFFTDLGFAKPLPLEIKEIAVPRMPEPWREINTLTASYGHGISVSPLQMVGAAAGIVGGGTIVRPTLMLEKQQQARRSEKTNVRIVSEKTSAKMRQLMRLVVSGGTARAAEVPGYEVGGKTGTADKPFAGGYDRNRKLSSFLGFFPMEKPRYAVFVLVDEPKGNAKSHGYATGGWVGAPAVGRIVAAMAPLMDMPPKQGLPDHDIAAGLYQYVHDEKTEGSTVASY
jgi:cell division protein FtsI (penicillin-binding protein 3)